MIDRKPYAAIWEELAAEKSMVFSVILHAIYASPVLRIVSWLTSRESTNFTNIPMYYAMATQFILLYCAVLCHPFTIDSAEKRKPEGSDQRRRGPLTWATSPTDLPFLRSTIQSPCSMPCPFLC